MTAIGQEQDGKGWKVCIENEEMQRAKYQGSTIKYYKKSGTICIQGGEIDVMRIRDQIAEDDEEQEKAGAIEQKVERWKNEEQVERKDQNKERNNGKIGGRNIIRKLEDMRDGINAEMNQHIRKLKEMLAKTEEKEQKEDTDMQLGKNTVEEIKTETKKREREEDDPTIEKISFGINTI